MHGDDHGATWRALRGTAMLTTVGLGVFVATVVWGQGPHGGAQSASPSDRATVDAPTSPPTTGASVSADAAVIDVYLPASTDAGSMVRLLRDESMALLRG